jgi:hypothetical protein
MEDGRREMGKEREMENGRVLVTFPVSAGECRHVKLIFSIGGILESWNLVSEASIFSGLPTGLFLGQMLEPVSCGKNEKVGRKHLLMTIDEKCPGQN